MDIQNSRKSVINCTGFQSKSPLRSELELSNVYQLRQYFGREGVFRVYRIWQMHGPDMSSLFLLLTNMLLLVGMKMIFC